MKPMRNQSISGMTILEVIAVVAILGILAAIAAPGWLAFANRQRANRATDQVLQSIRTAQSNAKRTRRTRTVEFKTVSGVPQIVSDGVGVSLGEGDLKAGTVSLAVTNGSGAAVNPPQLSFMSNGGLDSVDLPVSITVQVPANDGLKKCVIVRSLLGATQKGSGDECG